MSQKREIDEVTGIETTGHTWDGLKELNKPLPRWWVLTFYATIIWALGYMVAYPAWPTLTSYTKGWLGYSQRTAVTHDVKAAVQAQAGSRDQLAKQSFAEVKASPDLLRFAIGIGGATFQTNCAPCHGRGAQGFVGYPNLKDDEWLWGGTLEDIQKSILYGIRSGHKEARDVQMPRYGIDKLLTAAQINDSAEFVLSLSGRSTDTAAVQRGAAVYKDQCAQCHGPDGKGKTDQGAPNLTDAIWLYGSSKEAVLETIRTGRSGVMPAWSGRLDPITIKALAIYVHSLGGGK